MKTKIHKITAVFIGILCWSTGMAFAATNLPLKVKKAPDTIAGYSTVFESSYGTPDAEVTFHVQKPDGSVFELPAQTSVTGVAKADFLGFHTKRSGTYQVSVYYWDFNQERPAITNFQVYPDVVSPSRSQVLLNQGSIQADGTETDVLMVNLLDQYGNPIPDHRLTVISSRPEDSISETNAQGTDEHGRKTFEVSCSTAGVSFLSVFDQSTGIILEERAKLICFEPETEETIGGNLLQANIFGGEDTAPNSGPVSKFTLEFLGPNNQLNTAIIGSDQNYFTVCAVDAGENTVTNYTGSILISAPDDANAVLPNNGEYSFSPPDKGCFQFSLAFQFSQVGQHDIQVFAYDPDTGEIFGNIRGETTVTVLESADVPPGGDTGSTDESIEIKNPREGNKYGTNEITVTGKGPENSDLRIMLDGVQNGTLSTDSDGVFFSTVPNVTDGTHQLYLQSTIGDRRFSETISFSVDTTPPILEELQLYPTESVEAGKMLTVTVISEAGLKNVSIRLDGQELNLPENANRPGNYERSLDAPQVPGDYSLDVMLKDTLDNESKFAAQAMVKVSKPRSTLPPVPQDVQLIPEPEAMEVSWGEVTGHTENIALYVLYRGSSESELEEVKSVAANQTSALIENLEAGKEYYFAVSAVDVNGKEGLKSSPLSGRPLFSEELHTAGLRVEGKSGDGFVRISWEESSKSPDMYLVRYGIRSGEYVEETAISRLQHSATISDLINDIPYYFTVVPYTKGQPLTEEYAEISVTPRFGGMHPAAQTPLDLGVPKNSSSGPEIALILIGLSFVLVALVSFIAHRLRKVFQ